jgi:hypothetical protein
VRTPGVWSGGEPVQIGLAQEWPVLDSAKVSGLGDYCASNYIDVLEKLDAGDNRIRIAVSEASGILLMSCGPDAPATALKTSVRRFALSDSNSMVMVGVWLW